MIPPFDENGYLPSGIHKATLEEVDARFGRDSEIRRAQMESLRWLVDLARDAGLQRLVINGSFTTDAHEPNDVDCVLLIGSEYRGNTPAEDELLGGLPFLDIDLVRQPDFDIMVNRYYATDRSLISKGMIEVLLWA
jgi:hypothetical protein